MRAVFVLVVIAILAVNKAHGLKCYICDNCETYSDVTATDCEGEDSIILPEIRPEETTEAATTVEATTTPEATTTTEETTTTDDGKSTRSGVGLNENPSDHYRHRRAAARDDKHQCFKFSIGYGTGTMVKRGCTKFTNCSHIEDEYNKDVVSDCSLCDTDSCNPATNIKSWAFSSIVLIAIMKIFL